MPNPFSKLVNPRYPATALAFENGSATMVQLERARGSFRLKRAATVGLPESLVRPSFEESNVASPVELSAALRELAASAGLLQQKKWSVALPEASSRSLILTMDSPPASRSELEEVLVWKMERGFNAPLDELSISRERLQADAQGRERYLVVATKTSVLREYESALAVLGWRAGLIVPRHIGEGQWLTLNGAAGDSLLLSSSENAFTAVVFRGKQPLILRTIACEPDECEDELFRLLLFYRDRRGGESDQPGRLTRVLIVGDLMTKDRASEIVSETLGGGLRSLEARDLGLEIATRELSFDAIVAPAGLATLPWQ